MIIVFPKYYYAAIYFFILRISTISMWWYCSVCYMTVLLLTRLVMCVLDDFYSMWFFTSISLYIYLKLLFPPLLIRSAAYFSNSKVPFKRKAWGLRPKSHMILIEIKIEARYLKKNSQTPQDKNCENLNRSNTYGFWASNLVLFSWTGLYILVFEQWLYRLHTPLPLLALKSTLPPTYQYLLSDNFFLFFFSKSKKKV